MFEPISYLVYGFTGFTAKDCKKNIFVCFSCFGEGEKFSEFVAAWV